MPELHPKSPSREGPGAAKQMERHPPRPAPPEHCPSAGLLSPAWSHLQGSPTAGFGKQQELGTISRGWMGAAALLWSLTPSVQCDSTLLPASGHTSQNFPACVNSACCRTLHFAKPAPGIPAGGYQFHFIATGTIPLVPCCSRGFPTSHGDRTVKSSNV